MGLTIETFQEARRRIAAHILPTRILHLTTGMPQSVVDGPALDDRIADVWLKLECLQVTGSFKARGALNRVLSLPPAVAARGIVTASGGNHGLAVAYAGRVASVPTTVYLPSLASPDKVARIARWGATTVTAGDVWDDAHAAALAHAARDGLTYVHPFADPEVVAGQGTIALEILEADPAIDALVVAIGGGGLAAGVATAAKLLRPGIRVVGVEPVGAPTLRESIAAGEVITLPAIATKAGTLAPRRSDPYTFELVRSAVDDIVLVSDDEMKDAARYLFANAGVGVELSGAAAVAAMLQKRVELRGARRPCALVCGAGTDAC